MYTVKKDDTLRKLAIKRYGFGFMWRLIYFKNRKALSSPDVIYAGQKIKL